MKELKGWIKEEIKVIKMEQERVIIISIVEYSLSMIVPLMRYMKTNTIKKVIT